MMQKSKRIYLDHAATSWPRLPGVVEAMQDFELHAGAAAGRGSYSSAMHASSKVEQLRIAVAGLINAHVDEVAFVTNGTAANNAALAGILLEGDHAITTQADHNSTLRPLQLLQTQRRIQWDAAVVDQAGRVDANEIRKLIRPNTKLICVTTASNVTGAINDLQSISAIAKEHGILLMVDAAQTLGYQPIDMKSLGIDVLCAPGHKGCGGPLGTGVIAANKRLHSSWNHLWIGGTGEASNSVSDDFSWRSVIESGNLNTTAIAGWLAGMQSLTNSKLPWATMLESLQQRLKTILIDSPIGKMIGHDDKNYLPVFSIDCSGSSLAPSDWAALLDADFQIEARSGWHCAAYVHRAIGTVQGGGTLRFSLGHTSTNEDLDGLQAAIEQIRSIGF